MDSLSEEVGLYLVSWIPTEEHGSLLRTSRTLHRWISEQREIFCSHEIRVQSLSRYREVRRVQGSILLSDVHDFQSLPEKLLRSSSPLFLTLPLPETMNSWDQRNLLILVSRFMQDRISRHPTSETRVSFRASFIISSRFFSSPKIAILPLEPTFCFWWRPDTPSLTLAFPYPASTWSSPPNPHDHPGGDIAIRNQCIALRDEIQILLHCVPSCSLSLYISGEYLRDSSRNSVALIYPQHLLKFHRLHLDYCAFSRLSSFLHQSATYLPAITLHDFGYSIFPRRVVGDCSRDLTPVEKFVLCNRCCVDELITGRYRMFSVQNLFFPLSGPGMELAMKIRDSGLSIANLLYIPSPEPVSGVLQEVAKEKLQGLASPESYANIGLLENLLPKVEFRFFILSDG